MSVRPFLYLRVLLAAAGIAGSMILLLSSGVSDDHRGGSPVTLGSAAAFAALAWVVGGLLGQRLRTMTVFLPLLVVLAAGGFLTTYIGRRLILGPLAPF
jgi:hypothetical protein